MTTGCRDWVSTLRRASYRGVPFYVEQDDVKTGRRLVVHEFPHKDVPYVEDLGRAANLISVTGYVADDAIESVESRLRGACERGGPASLNLPIGRFQAHCEECRREYKLDKLGYVAFRMGFVREGSGAAPFAAIGAARVIEFAASSITTPLREALVATYNAVGVASHVYDAAVGLIQTFAADFESSVRAAPFSVETAPVVLQQVESMFGLAVSLAKVGTQPDEFLGTAYFARSETETTAEIVDRITGLFALVNEGLPPLTAAEFLAGWATYGNEAGPAPVTPSGRRAQANAVALVNTIRASALAQYATAVVLRDYANRREAIQARADAAEFFDAHLYTLEGWQQYEAWKQLFVIRGQVADYLSRLIITLAPVQGVSAPRRMPALWWANRLYGDANRAEELVAFNRVKHAGFMPIEFEALTV